MHKREASNILYIAHNIYIYIPNPSMYIYVRKIDIYIYQTFNIPNHSIEFL